MRKKRKVLFIVAAVVIIGATFLVTKYISDLKEYRRIIATLEINDVDLSNVADGTYSGCSDAILVSAEVKVRVENGRIKDIELIRHDHGRGETAEVIPQRVLNAQSLDVEMVTGATSSCKVILKAIENALNSAVE